MFSKIKELDFFRKVNQDIERKQTSSGGFISITMLIMIAALSFNEIYLVLFGEPNKYPYVDISNEKELIRVNLNISFYYSPCQALSLD